jgi:hypothetical protein
MNRVVIARSGATKQSIGASRVVLDRVPRTEPGVALKTGS